MLSTSKEAHHSGWSDELIMDNTHQPYKSENKNLSFIFVDYWRLLQNKPKWNANNQQVGAKRIKVSESGQYTSSSNAYFCDNEVCKVHPIGQKTANKEKGVRKRETRHACILHGDW